MRPTRALIHREHLAHNLSTIRSLVAPGTAVCAAVKADGYGHGAVAVAQVLAGEGIEAFGVATVDEGLALRQVGIRQPLFLLGTLQPEELPGALEAGLDLFVWSQEAIEALGLLARGRSTPLRVHVKVDTGMGRVGCRPEDAEALAGAVVHSLPLELAGVCTHFASSDGPGPVTPAAQLARFGEVLSALKARGWTPRYIHAANSGALQSAPDSHFNLVRPGLAVYGYPAPDGQGAPAYAPVMELVTKVGYVKTVPAGTPLSYGSRYVTSRTTDVATLPLGYADGYRRSLTNKAPVWIAGRSFTVSGTVCMDQFLVDLGPDSAIKAGDPVILFGAPDLARAVQPPTAADLATLADTIVYEILCGVSPRVTRVLV